MRIIFCIVSASFCLSCKTNSASKVSSDEPISVTCDSYPLEFRAPNPNAEAEAQTALKAIPGAEKASLDWNSAQQTLKSLNRLGIKLVGCDKDNRGSLNKSLAAFLESHPALFQFDAGEWDLGANQSCKDAAANGSSFIVSFYRKALGPETIVRDKISLALIGGTGPLTISNVFGDYLPSAKSLPKLLSAMKSCPDMNERAVYEGITSHTFMFTRLENCTPVPAPPGTYQFQDNDFIKYEKTYHWEWMAEGKTVKFYKVVNAEVEINEGNFSPDVRSSDAYCDLGGDIPPFAGFSSVIDAVSNRVLTYHSGIRGCRTCLK